MAAQLEWEKAGKSGEKGEKMGRLELKSVRP